ncbi:MAG: hypothetical protein LBR29_08830 [Methylobacteriaceae bacterium]|jgi:hypothetical protein|nr:hypothetical protein [Methylobacteriaceae bacterium]
MPVSTGQIIRRTLEILGVVGAGQTVSAEDDRLVRETLTAAAATLAARGIVDVEADCAADAIPDDVVLPLAAVVARWAAPAYGFGGTDLAALKMLADEAEADLRSRPDTSGDPAPVRVKYF